MRRESGKDRTSRNRFRIGSAIWYVFTVIFILLGFLFRLWFVCYGGESGNANNYAIAKHSREERKLFVCASFRVFEDVPFAVCPVSGVSIGRPSIKKARWILNCVFIGWIIHDFNFSSCWIFSFKTLILFASVNDASLIFSA